MSICPVKIQPGGEGNTLVFGTVVNTIVPVQSSTDRVCLKINRSESRLMSGLSFGLFETDCQK